MKKLEMVHGALNVLVALGVSSIVGGALVLCQPNKMGVIKKIATGIGGLAISSMAVDGVNEYVDKQFHTVVEAVKGIVKTKPVEETPVIEDIESEEEA